MELFIPLWSFLNCSFKYFEARLPAIVNIVQLNGNFYQYVSLCLINICILNTSDALTEVLNQVFHLSKYCFSAQTHSFAHFVKMNICPSNTYFYFASWYYIKLDQEGAWRNIGGVKGLLTCQAPIICAACPRSLAPVVWLASAMSTICRAQWSAIHSGQPLLPSIYLGLLCSRVPLTFAWYSRG